MGAIDFKEIPTAQCGPSRDEFELFAEEFLLQEGFRIIEGVDRGADNGRDLIVEEIRTGPGGDSVIRWLVSCKHKAHGGGSVTPSDESNIRDRIDMHKCTGFIAFYSAVPSSGLAANLKALKSRYEVLTYGPAQIEPKLLDRPDFRKLAARYFPTSFNAWIQNSRAVIVKSSADPQRALNRFFLRQPHTRLEDALAEAKVRKLLVFLVIYDSLHPKNSRLDYSLGNFMDYETTKRLVDTHFVPVVGVSSAPLHASLVPEDNPLELALWVVLDCEGRIVRREGVYANPDEGLKRVRSVIALECN